MAPVANPTRSSRSRSFRGRHSPMYLLSSKEVRALVNLPVNAALNVPDRTRSRALAEATRVESVAEAAAPSSLSFSEYSDYYERPRAGIRISGNVSDAVPTELEWEIGG